MPHPSRSADDTPGRDTPRSPAGMVGGRLHTVDELLAPFDGDVRLPAAPALVRAPTGRTADRRSGDSAHDRAHWWHEPEWLHRTCCEGEPGPGTTAAGLSARRP